jgi:hypothetical protein
MQIINFTHAHWQIILTILIIVAIAVAAYVDWQFSQLDVSGPRDITGNGITVGLAKAFDNRSLALRIERLSNSLAQMKVVDQKFSDNIGKTQGYSQSSQTLTLDLKAAANPVAVTAAGGADKPTTAANATDGRKTTDPADANKTESKGEVALSASDILNEQLNLASQILNLQTLYERSLTDRLLGGHARLQTVLGFQVSIAPPAGFENCVAVVEVAVRLKEQPPAIQTEPEEQNITPDLIAAEKPEELKSEIKPENQTAQLSVNLPEVKKEAKRAPAKQAPKPEVVLPSGPQSVSLVAMIPQEKTYNAQTISTNSQSIGGSAVASVMNLGFTRKGESKQLFIHRDSDTVAFERDPRNEPKLLDKSAVFGWEFRPVLGHETVSPGMRQMLAVIALPVMDHSQYAQEAVLEIKTRSYWRRYDRKSQTSGPKWHWSPKQIDGSFTTDSEVQELTIPNTAKVQEELSPKVSSIRWVNSGSDRATVIVRGENFFPGTKVFAGGKVYREEDGSLVLKSDQALEFETTLTAITTGDSVLSGRFGPSLQLNVNRDLLPVPTLYMTRAAIKPTRRGKDLRISIDIKGLDENGDDCDLEFIDLEGLPDPIVFVGNEPLPMPYDYWPLPPATQTPLPTDTTTAGYPFSFSTSSTKKSLRVEAWIPSRIQVSRNSSVMFRVPFCGLDYQASQPLRYFEPTVTRIGADAVNTVFRISHSFGSTKTLSVELDQTYLSGSPSLQMIPEGDGDHRFTISNTLVSQYTNMIIRIEGTEPYVVALPAAEKPKPKPAFDLNARPVQITRATIGPAEWSGTDLQAITNAWLVTTPPGAGGAVPMPIRTPASFTVYEGGKKIVVYFNESTTILAGKAEVEFQWSPNVADSVRVPLFIAPPAPSV